MAVGRGNGVRRRRAVSFGPARQQPVGRVEHGRIERGEPRGAFARQAPQHRIDQTGKARRMPVGLHQPYREIDRGVVGHAEKQNLRGADEERGLDARRLRRRAAFEQAAEQMTQRAEPAQHGGDDGARQRPVALLEQCEFGRGVEQFVERTAAAQHAVDHVGGDAPDGEAGRIVIAAGTRPWFSPSLHRENDPSSRTFPGCGAARSGAPLIRDRSKLRTCGGPGSAAHHFATP